MVAKALYLFALLQTQAQANAPGLNREELLALLDTDVQARDLAAAEARYEALTLERLLADLTFLYTQPAERIRLSYTDFTPESARARDGGYGLHTVKRYDDGERTIIVNEHRRFVGGRLQPVSEIRIRTRVFPAPPGRPRGAPGSEHDYVVGRFRIGWYRPVLANGSLGSDTPLLFREPRYKKGRDRYRRQAIFGVHACYSCHTAGNRFAPDFADGRPIDAEVIVQAPYLQGDLRGSMGYTKLMKHLTDRGYSEEYQKALDHDLVDEASESMRLDALVPALEQALARGDVPVLPQDEVLPLAQLPNPEVEGIYAIGELILLDSVEAILRKQYRRGTAWTEHSWQLPRQRPPGPARLMKSRQ